jgi:hypothetical protein
VGAFFGVCFSGASAAHCRWVRYAPLASSRRCLASASRRRRSSEVGLPSPRVHRQTVLLSTPTSRAVGRCQYGPCSAWPSAMRCRVVVLRSAVSRAGPVGFGRRSRTLFLCKPKGRAASLHDAEHNRRRKQTAHRPSASGLKAPRMGLRRVRAGGGISESLRVV